MNSTQISEDQDGSRFDGLSVYETLEEVIGPNLTRRLCDLYGGRTVYVPREPMKAGWLAQAVGLDAARKLCDHYTVGNTGVRVAVPKGDNVQLAGRAADVARMTDEGMSAGDIAIALNIHERSVYRARRKVNRQRAKRLGKLIRRLKREGRSVAEIALELKLPVHSTRAIINVLEAERTTEARRPLRLIGEFDE